jgi:hypothetical protein
MYAEIARLYGKNKSSIHEVMKNKRKNSLLYLLLRIRLKCQNPVLSHVQEREREREYTVNVQCSVQYTLLLLYLMLLCIIYQLNFTIFTCYMNITLCIAFGIIHSFP